MITKEPGVLPESRIYIHEASAFASRTLIHVPFCGDYHCVEPYQIDRMYMDSFLLIFIDNGQLELAYQGQNTILDTGSLRIIDCKVPHKYRALGDLHFHWVHFQGSNSQLLYDYLNERQGASLGTLHHHSVVREFNQMFQILSQSPINELQANLALIQLLTTLIQISEGKQVIGNMAVHQVLIHMNEHFLEGLQLEDLARSVNMSTCHFARVFRRQYNIPPHEYLLNLRISAAKKALLMSDQSIENVAGNCGFNSTSHFIRAFKQRVGITPAQFRKQKF